MHDVAIYIPVQDWDYTEDLPPEWAPPSGWRFAKRLILSNDTERVRVAEPVEADIDIHVRQITDLQREVRVARASHDEPLQIVASQIHLVDTEDDFLRCRLFFLADVASNDTTTYVILYGNPKAPAPDLETDLIAEGEGYALRIENSHYHAELSALSGNWKCHCPKGWEARLDSGGGHGVEGTIHWGPDWSEERVGRYRITSWDGPSMFEYEVLSGPVCLRVTRRGHPILSLGPRIGRPHKVMATVVYTFWAGQPFVIMESKLEVIEDVRFRDCRNDEFVLGEELPERAWMDPDGTIGFGARGWDGEDPRVMLHFNKTTGEAFGSIHLEFENTNPNFTEPDGAGFSRTGVWVRSPVHHANMQAGDYVYEKNAYLQHHFVEGGEHQGFGELVSHQQRLLHPVTQVQIQPIPKIVSQDHVRDALRGTNEFELYLMGSPWGQRQLSFVDIGIIRRVAIDGDDIHIDLVMPYAGRETWFDWFSDRIREQLAACLHSVGKVDIHLVRVPDWSPEQMTDRARRAIG